MFNHPVSSIHGISQARVLVLPFLPPGDLPNPGIEPMTPMSAALLADSLFKSDKTPDEPGYPKNREENNI